MARISNTRSELMAAIRSVSAARDLPPEVILDALKAALVSAYHKMPDAEATNVTVDIDEMSGETRVHAHYAVMEARYIEDPNSEWSLEEAHKLDPEAVVGSVITLDVTPQDFGRIAAQTAKQVIQQRLNEAVREQTYTTYADREGEIVYGTVQTVNRDYVTVALDRVEAILPKSNQIPGERYSPNQRIRAYVSEVKRSAKGPQVIISRTHREMLQRLMDLEIPEVFQGTVEIKAIAREAGSRSKVAVWSGQAGVDPVGACVGMRGVRIQALVRELGGEKIDIVEWNADPRQFIANALSPSKVLFVGLEEASERRTANVVVPDSQLSLAIGREGQNARLAAKLTGWRIDIRSESESSDMMDQIREVERRQNEERARQAAAAAAAREARAAEVAAELAVAPADTAPAPAAPAEPVEALPVAEPVAAERAPEAAAEAAPETAVPAPGPAGEEDAAGHRRAGEIWDEAYVGDEEDDELEPGRKRKARKLVRNPVTGQLEVQHQRKRTRRRPEWEEDVGRWSEEDLDDALGFTEFDFLSEEDDGGETA